MTRTIQTLHRIGAVSSLSGVAVPTLRVWESRYGAFAPFKSRGRHRLYSDDDVLKAGLLRQLTSNGHAISTIANLDVSELNALLNKHRQSAGSAQQSSQSRRIVSVAIISVALATRFQSNTLHQSIAGLDFQLTDTFVDLDSALHRPFQSKPDILLVRVNTLHMGVHASLKSIIDQHQIQQVIVLYSYGQDRVADAMKSSGMIVRREPIVEAELVELINAALLIDPRCSNDFLHPGVMIPARKYSDEVLVDVAGISTNVLCECPRHVAELITQLANFEQYSQECLSNTDKDAHLHAQLASISGTARAMFERALEMVAEHEGITLKHL